MCAGSDVLPMWSTMAVGAASGLAFLAAKVEAGHQSYSIYHFATRSG